MPEKKKRKKLTEEEKKEKFGDKYNPNYAKDGSRTSSSKDQKDANPPYNDGMWYALSKQIMEDVASIPYNWITGVTADISVARRSGVNGATVTTTKNTLANWAILILNYHPSVGRCETRTAGLNMAATQLYTMIRRANSGARNYEAADVMMYVLAMADIYAEVAELKRAFGLAGLYNQRNHYLPETIMASLGINPVDFRQNFAQYRGQLNILISKINAFAVPKYFTLFNRRAFVALNVFADSDSVKGQFYAFRKAGYYTWSPTESSEGTQLTYTRRSTSANTVITMGQRLATLESQLDALFLDDDANTMSGDILKAFGAEKCHSIDEVTVDYFMEPKFDENILAQIENSVCYTTYTGGGYLDAQSLNVKQNNQLITYLPNIPLSAGMVTINKMFFNSHKDQPTAEDNLEWTRVRVTANAETPNLVLNCGLELLEDYSVFRFGADNGDVTALQPERSFNNFILSSQGNTLAAVMTFDWHPIVYVFNSSTSGTFNFGADFKNVTIVDQAVVTRMHEMANAAVVWNPDLYKAAQKPDVR